MNAPAPADLAPSPIETVRAKSGNRDGIVLIEAILCEWRAGQVALVSSFGAESAVLLDMVARVDPTVPVIFLDTGKLFAETLAFRDAMVERLGLRDVRSVAPAPSELRRHDPDGTLWSLEPDQCCHWRKTEPLDRALVGFAAWITGRKRFHGGSRDSLQTLQLDAATGRIKINPLAPWSEDDLWRYMSERDLPVHPLVRYGYRSIGCEPCTRAVAPGESPRAGRWAWLDKTECGIHGDGI